MSRVRAVMVASLFLRGNSSSVECEGQNGV
jgi:hypothetical protein